MHIHNSTIVHEMLRFSRSLLCAAEYICTSRAHHDYSWQKFPISGTFPTKSNY